jgi:hypothetical protein
MLNLILPLVLWGSLLAAPTSSATRVHEDRAVPAVAFEPHFQHRYTNATLPSAHVASDRFQAVSGKWFARLAGLREPEVFARAARQSWDAELAERALTILASR